MCNLGIEKHNLVYENLNVQSNISILVAKHSQYVGNKI